MRDHPAVHIVLPAPSPRPIGGYKVAYEYANALAADGLSVHVWHSESMRAFQQGRRRLWPAIRSLLAWWLRGQRSAWRRDGVTWFPFDRRVDVRATGWFPRLRVHHGDAVLATAVETAPFVARVGRAGGALTAVLIQHHETWAEEPEWIAAGWRAVDERIVIAPWLADEVAKAGLDSHLLPNALVADAFPPGPPLSDRPKRVLSLLSPHGYKRPDVVAAVLEEVARRRPDIEACTFGQEPVSPVPSAHVEYAADPSPDRLRGLYQSSRVYFCGSDEEGWHLPPAEATLSGAAVVSTDIGGVRASMADDARYAPRGDVEGLVIQVIAAVDDVASSQERVDRARRRIAETTYAENARRLRGILRI
jgi:glycosyltransferase involved in cell wall biosynthesis